MSTALSADSNAAFVGGYEDNNDASAVWVFIRSANTCAQQSTKLEPRWQQCLCSSNRQGALFRTIS
jgi:hypothetical protein